ncbi:MAG: cyclic nucleotide-binding domain-containing protein [Reichenbachiella sp.]
MKKDRFHIDLDQLTDFDWLKKTFFSDPDQRIELKKGDIIMHQGDQNDKIYFVESGKLSGYYKVGEGEKMKLFSTKPGMIAGIYSFFSPLGHSYTTVKANEDSVVFYIDKSQVPNDGDEEYSLFLKHMLPVIVNEIYLRQMTLKQSERDKQIAMKKLIQSEKLATLGQLSAGLAHELNNAIGVIQNKTTWLTDHLRQFFGGQQDHGAFQFFDNGLKKGQSLSSSEIRSRKKVLMDKIKVKDSQAKRLAKMDLTDEELNFISRRRSENFMNEVHYFWETGIALHDMNIAAKHTTHVINSIKDLGKPIQDHMTNCDVSVGINKALTLLTSLLKYIEVELDLEDGLTVFTNKGKLVQVWVNLIKNAAECLTHEKTENPKISISSKTIHGMIDIKIIDNGPGIKPEIMDTIFQPNVTTKVDGISFGLGLGLSIVQRIIVETGGTITVESVPGNTAFKILIPK